MEVKLTINAEDRSGPALASFQKNTKSAFESVRGAYDMAKGWSTDSSGVLKSAFDTLNIGSAASMDQAKARVNGAFEAIKNSASSSASEIVRAEAARAKAIEDIDKQNFASRESLLDKFKANWLGITAGLTAAWAATDWLRGSMEKAFEAEVAFNKLRIQVEGLGIAFESESPKIDAAVKKTAAYARVQDEDVAGALQQLIFLTGDLDGSMQNLNLVYDLAYQKGISNSEAATLIGKAMAGNVDMLGRFIPELHNLDATLGSNATEAEKTAFAFSVLEEKAKGALDKMTEHEKQLREARKSWEDFRQTLGEIFVTIAGSVGQVFKDLSDNIEHGAPSLKALAFGHAEASVAAAANAEAHKTTSKEIAAAIKTANDAALTLEKLSGPKSADASNDIKRQSDFALQTLDAQHSRGLVSETDYYNRRQQIVYDAYSKQWDVESKEFDRLVAAQEKVDKEKEFPAWLELEGHLIAQNTKLNSLSFDLDQQIFDNKEKYFASDKARQQSGLKAEIDLARALGEHVATVHGEIAANASRRTGMDAVTMEILDQVDALKLLQAQFVEAHANDDLRNRISSLNVAEDPYASGMESIRQRYDQEKEWVADLAQWKIDHGKDASKEFERLNLLEKAETKETELFKKHEWERGAQSFADSLGTIGDALMQGNKRQFETGKDMAITSAVIDTYLGAQRVFTALAGIPVVGPELGAIAAGAAIAAGMVRVQMIESQHYKEYAEGGALKGGVPGKDSIPILAMEDEYIIKADSARKLGAARLEFMNQTGEVPKFGLGGFVSSLASNPIAQAIINPTVLMNPLNEKAINGAIGYLDRQTPNPPVMTQSQLDEDLARRLMVLNGATEDQLKLYDLRIEQDAKLQQAQQAGLDVTQLITVQSAEYAKAVQDIIDAQKEAQTALDSDARSRILLAQGLDTQADLEDLRTKQTDELNDAYKKGLDVTDLVTAQTLEWGNAVKEVSETISEADQKMIDASKKALTDLISYQSSILGTLKGIMTGPESLLSPEARYSQAMTRFNTASPDDLAAAATDFLDASKAYNASGPAFQADLASITSALGIAGGLGGNPTLGGVTGQLEKLDKIKTAVDDSNLNIVANLAKDLDAGSDLVKAINSVQTAIETGKGNTAGAAESVSPPNYRTAEWASFAVGTQAAPGPVMKMIVDLIPDDLQYDVDKSGTITNADALMLMKMSQGLLPLPSYDVGTPYVHGDQRAMIHDSEIIMDPVVSGGLRKYGIRVQAQGGMDVAPLLEEVRALRIVTEKMQIVTEKMQKKIDQLEAHAANNVLVTADGFRKSIEVNNKQVDHLGTIAGKTRLAATTRERVLT